MARIPIAPPGMKDQRPRYTLGWRVGNTIYVAGQLPYDKDGNLVGKGDIKAQTRRIFEQIKMIVEAGGGKMDDVVKVTVFVTDVRYREAYGEVRSEFFGANPPASTLVQISNLAIPDALIEIEAVAALEKLTVPSNAVTDGTGWIVFRHGYPTMFTSRPGTMITFFGARPASSSRTRVSASAADSIAARSASAGRVIRLRTLPSIGTGTSIVASRVSASSSPGHGSYASVLA